MTTDWTEDDFKKAVARAGVRDARNLFRSSLIYLPGLYLGFWILDLLYAPAHKWLFLSFRVAMATIAYVLYRISMRSTRVQTQYWLGIIYSFFAANFITAMIALTEGPSSGYYAGLNLVGLAAIWFIPANVIYLTIAIICIYVPYFSLSLFLRPESYTELVLNISFIIGTLMMALFIRYAHKRSRDSEIRARFRLKQEVRQRETIIKQKTEEALTLQRLSSHFSPQVVDGIKRGEIKIDGRVKRTQVAAMFVDIVESTDRVVKLDREAFDQVLRRFMEESYGVLLKYDLTIDKFLGDGIMAFSNEPVKRFDFIQRTCFAAVEIKKRLASESEWFERLWRKQFLIRAGISVGYANVGFHGSDLYYKSYTAIGRPIAMAARLCSIAEPNQIIVDGDIQEAIAPHGFQTDFVGKKSLRGFEGEIAYTYALTGVPSQDFVNTGAMSCISCGGNVLTLEESNGIYFMKCRSCGAVLKAAA